MPEAVGMNVLVEESCWRGVDVNSEEVVGIGTCLRMRSIIWCPQRSAADQQVSFCRSAIVVIL